MLSNNNIDTLRDSSDDLAVSVKSILNDAYCRDASGKTRSALDAKRGNGEYVGACPIYGYQKADDNHNRLVPDDYAAEIVRDIFRMKVDGLSALRIAETLNGRGVLSPIMYKKDRGLPHPKNGFADKEDAPVDAWKITENAHAAIIDKNRFDLVQKIIRLDTRTAPAGDKVYVFSGILICGCCGNRMSRKTVPYKGTKYHYYFCPTTKKGGCAEAVMLKEDFLMNVVLESVKAHIANVASLETLVAGLDADKMSRELSTRISEQLSDNERRLDKIREFKAGLYENMMSGNLSKDEYKSLKDKYSRDAGQFHKILQNRTNIKKKILTTYDTIEIKRSVKNDERSMPEEF